MIRQRPARAARSASTDVAGDRVDDHRPQRLGAGRGPCRRRAAGWRRGSARRCARRPRARSACRRDRGSPASGTSSARSCLGAVAAGVDRRQLTRRALRVERAVERRGRQRLDRVGVVVALRLPDLRRDRRLDVRPRVRSAAGSAARRRPPGRRRRLGVAGRAHDRRQAGDAGRVLDGHRLHDHPAHRRAERCGPARCRGGRAGRCRRRPCRTACRAPSGNGSPASAACITRHRGRRLPVELACDSPQSRLS